MGRRWRVPPVRRIPWTLRRVLRHAERRGVWPSAADLAEHSRLSRWTFREDLRSLAEAGLVVLEGGGRNCVWRITGEGFALLGVEPFAPRHGGRAPSSPSWAGKEVRRLRRRLRRLAAARVGDAAGDDPAEGLESLGD